jgi:hypothetical protein
MPHSPARFLTLLLVLAVTAAGPPASAGGPDTAAHVRAEIERLRQSLKDHPLSGAEREQLAPACDAALRTSAEALDAGRLYLSLEAIGRATELIEGARFVAATATASQALPAFEAEWREASEALTAVDRSPDSRSWRRSRAAVRALSESAAGRIVPLLEGARGFAVATKPADGRFYIGQARGVAGFADFCASLEFQQKLARYPLRSMLPELHRLQEKTTAAFQPPRSIEQHARFIALNSSLKLGFELDAAQSYAGSAYQYLEAVRHFGMLEAPPLDGPGQAGLKADLDAARARLAASERDDSLAQIFLERAASQIAHADGSEPSADEWRSARVILDQVLPAYSAARLPATPGEATTRRALRMTLVRWPYT